MNRFLDTSGIFPLLDDSDLNHASALEMYRSSDYIVIHNYVIAEIVALCDARRLRRSLVLDFLDVISGNPAVETVWILPDLQRQAIGLLRSRQDKRYSLCDAVSFVVMREFEIQEAITTDHHFEQEGFVRLLKP